MIQANGDSVFRLTFRIDSGAQAALRGDVRAQGGPAVNLSSARVRLMDQGGQVIAAFLATPDPNGAEVSVSFDETRDLPAGQYTLEADAGTAIDATVPPNGSGSASFDARVDLSRRQCPADFNGDGVVDSQDFYDFLNEFFAYRSRADFNNDGVVNSQDFFDFLTAFFAGCP